MLDFIANEGFLQTFERHGVDQFQTPRAYRERYINAGLKRLAERG